MKRPKYTKQKAKSLLKIASKTLPESIQTLKRSLSINNSNLLSFVSSLQQCEEINFKNSQKNQSKKILAKKIDDNIIKQEGGLITEHKEGILLKKELRTRKKIREEMKIGKGTLQLKSQMNDTRRIFDAHFLKLQQKKEKKQANSKYQFIPKPQSKSLFLFNNKQNRPTTCRFSLKTQEPSRISFSERMPKRDHKSLSNTQQFWMKRGNSSTNRELKQKTEYSSKLPVGRTLSQLTDYSPRQQSKAMNYLILQLQINLACEKHKRLNTAL